MTTNLRLWGLGCGVGAVALLAGGFFLGVQPALAAAAQTDQQTDSIAAQNQVSMTTLSALSRQGAKLADMQAQQKVLLKAVPAILKPNTFIRRVNEVAAIDNVSVQGVTPSLSVPYVAAAATADAGASTAAGSGTSTASGAAPTAAGSAAAAPAGITGSDFALVPVTVQVNGSPSALLQFAHDIQVDERLFSISGVSSATGDDGTATTTFSGYIYTLQR